MNIDVYTPWREDLEALRARHVGRADVLEAISKGVAAHLAERSPLPLYVFGPRGSGKSHLLGLCAKELRPQVEAAGLKLLTVSEDIPELTSAEAVLARVRAAQERPGWMRWAQGPAAPQPVERAVVFFEALDKHLIAMPEEQRRALRRLLEREGLYVVATGCTLPDALTGKNNAFYGAFQAWPLGSLTDEEAVVLLEHVAGDAATGTATWPARCAALISLAGGSPRTLVALGAACGQAPDVWASEHLHTVVRQFTAHYQLRFKDLSPQTQQIVEQLSIAPRELTPTELSERLGFSASQASTLCRRLLEEGVVLDRQEGRHTWYRMGEPLFRFWYEYRTAPWEQTRIAWLGRMIEVVMSPVEMAVALLENPDEGIHEVIGQALQRSVKVGRVRAELVERFGQAMDRGDQPAACRVIQRWGMTGASPDETFVVRMAARTGWRNQMVRDALGPLLERAGATCLVAAWRFEELLDGGVAPKDAFLQLLDCLPSVSKSPSAGPWFRLLDRVVARLDALPERRGQPWVLHASERRRLARAPFLRVAFLQRGKLPSHRALLSAEDVLAEVHRAPILDWSPLLSASVRVRSERLTQALLVAGLEMEPAPSLPHNFRPGEAELTDPSVFGRFLHRGGPASRHALASWGATLAQLEEADWAVALKILTTASHEENLRALVWLATSGLAALGLRAPERLEEIQRGLLSTDAAFLELAGGAHTLVQQLEPGKGHLQPELQRLRDLLQPRSA